MTVGQIATAGFAGVGGYFGGPMGASVGWMVGSWLFAEDADTGNDIIDPGAQELPGINQALRGVLLPVLFGTNRCESFHSWRKNFTPIRHESKSETGGGGKTGGSGGGGKGQTGGGAGGVSYTYKIDCMYHIGMTDGEYYLYGGWLYNERINDQTIAAIGQGFGSNSLVFGADESRPKEASVEFAEALFYPGGSSAAGWPHFRTEESIPVASSDTTSLGLRWKETAWIGFREMNLGQSPNIPMLQWEIGPGGGDLDLDDALIGHDQHGLINVPDSHSQVSANGKWYFSSTGATGRAIFGPSTELDITQYTQDIGAFVTTALQNSGIDHGLTFTTDDHGTIIPGTNYLLVWAVNIGTVTRLDWGWVLIDLSAVPDGSSPWLQGNVVGTMYRRSDGLDKKILRLHSVQQTGLKLDSDQLIVLFRNQVGANFSTNIQYIGRITDLLNDFDFGTTDTMSAKFNTFDGVWGDDYPGNSGHADHNANYFFTVPTVSFALGSPVIGTGLYSFVPRETARTSTNTYISGHAATYPDGFFVRMDLGSSAIIPSLNDEGVRNEDFKDSSGTGSIAPFEDDGRGQFSDPTNDAEYRPECHIHAWAGLEALGGHLLICHKIYYGSTEGAPFGINAGVRAFMYNPISGIFIQVAFATGSNPLFDMVADVGQNEANRYNWFLRRSIASYSEDTGDLTFFGAYDEAVLATQPIENSYVVAKFGELSIGGATDVPPPYIIRKILTSQIFGLGYTDANIDETSYALAVQYCEANAIKVSAKFRREQGYLFWVDNLLSLYNGYLTRIENTIFFNVMDFGSTTGSNVVRTLDNDHLVVERGKPPIRVIEGAQQDTYNKVRVNYIDRDLEYRQNFVEEDDEVDQDFNGIRAREFPPMFVMTEQLARNIAVRGLWSNLYARDGYEFRVGWKDADLIPGDLVTLVDSFDTKLSSGIRARLNKIEEVNPGVWKVNATEEIDYIVNATGLVNSGTNNSSGGFRRGLTGEPLLFNAYELPKEFQGANPTLYVGWAQSTRAAGAKLHISGDGVSFAEASDITPHTLSGIFADPLPARPRGYAESNVEVYLFPDVRSAAFNPSSPAYTETFALEDGGETQRSVGGTALWVGSEMASYQGITLIGSNHYRFTKVYRGWGGTPIGDHSSGAVFWRHGGGVFTQTINEDKVGTKIFYKVTPYNFSGWEWPASSVDAQTYTIQGTYFKPQIADCPHVWIDSVDYTNSTIRNISDLTSKDFKLEWNDSSRCEGYGTLGYGFNTYGHFLTDTLSHNWRVEVVGTGDTVVHSVVVNTPFFVYSAGQNLADNGAFRANVAFKVTPFHETFGDAIETSVVSLEFFT